jgi:hypothetical protein
MPTLSTPETEEKYRKYLQETSMDTACVLCDKEAVTEFKYWKIVENIFPYDLLAETHHMLMPIRHIPEKELTNTEKEEWMKIKEELVESKYDYIIENTFKNKSIPAHFHQQLIISKSEFSFS